MIESERIEAFRLFGIRIGRSRILHCQDNKREWWCGREENISNRMTKQKTGL